MSIGKGRVRGRERIGVEAVYGACTLHNPMLDLNTNVKGVNTFDK
jgi:hypothetical protein